MTPVGASLPREGPVLGLWEGKGPAGAAGADPPRPGAALARGGGVRGGRRGVLMQGGARAWGVSGAAGRHQAPGTQLPGTGPQEQCQSKWPGLGASGPQVARKWPSSRKWNN